MKRFLIPIAAAVAIVVAAFASTTEAAAQFRYGPMAGINVSTLKYKQDLFTVNQRVGPAAGLAAEMMFPGIGIGIGIDLGIHYQMRGACIHMGERLMWSSQGYGNENLFFHTVSIPVHIKLKWQRLNGLEDRIAPIVYGGPTFSFTAAHSDIKAMTYSGGDVSIDCGIGAEFYRRWQLTAGYSFGMTYLTKARILTDFSARANAWNVRLAYYF